MAEELIVQVLEWLASSTFPLGYLLLWNTSAFEKIMAAVGLVILALLGWAALEEGHEEER